MGETTNILLCGVGGQGVLLASHMLSQAALAEGYDVKQSEVHGMSQRGGSVISHLRFGENVRSPLIAPGQADLLFCLELLEATRYLPNLKPDGVVLASTLQINPAPVSAGLATYPEELEKRIEESGRRAHLLDARGLAVQAGNMKAENVVLIGALSEFLPFSDARWEEVIKENVPAKTLEINLEAFRLGKEEVTRGLQVKS